MKTDISHILDFLSCSTPDKWVASALANPEVMLIDHANCEKKAASTALNLMYRYVDKPDLQFKMSRLAREELRHYEQVMKIMGKRYIAYDHVSPSRYAAELRKHARTHDPDKLVDVLIIGAFIEARSCERFARIAPELDAELQEFYLSLLKSEARHYLDYINLAKKYAAPEKDLDARIQFFAQQEQQLIESKDTEFRFHSGVL